MGLGGQEVVGSEGYQARVNPVGGYRANAGGALVIDTGPAAERARNLGGAGGIGIHRYGQAEQTVRRQGMGIGAGPTAGTRGDIGTQMETLESLRDGTEQGTERGARKGVADGMKDIFHTNIGVLEGNAPGMDARDMQAFANSITNFSMTLSDVAQGQVPVDANQQPIAPTRGPLPNPQEAERTLRAWTEGQKNLISMKPAQSRDIKFVKQYLAVTKAVVQNNEKIAQQKNVEAFTIEGISARQLENLKKQEIGHRKSVRNASTQEEVASRASAAAKSLTNHITERELKLKRIKVIEDNLTSLGNKQLQNMKAYKTAQSGRIADYSLSDPSGTTYYGADTSHFGHGSSPAGAARKTPFEVPEEGKHSAQFKMPTKLSTQERRRVMGTLKLSEVEKLLSGKITKSEEKREEAIVLFMETQRKAYNARIQEFSTGEYEAEAKSMRDELDKAFKKLSEMGPEGKDVAVRISQAMGRGAAQSALDFGEKSEENKKKLNEIILEHYRATWKNNSKSIEGSVAFMEVLSDEQLLGLNKFIASGKNKQTIGELMDKGDVKASQKAIAELSLRRTKDEEMISLRIRDLAKTFATSSEEANDMGKMAERFAKEATNPFSNQTESAFINGVLKTLEVIVEDKALTIRETRNEINKVIKQSGIPSSIHAKMTPLINKKLERKEQNQNLEKAKKKAEELEDLEKAKLEEASLIQAEIQKQAEIQEEQIQQVTSDIIISKPPRPNPEVANKIQPVPDSIKGAPRFSTPEAARMFLEGSKKNAPAPDKEKHPDYIRGGEKERRRIRKDPKTGEYYNLAGRGLRSLMPQSSQPKGAIKGQGSQSAKEKYRRLYDKALMKGQDVPAQYRDPDMVKGFSPEARAKKTKEKQDAWRRGRHPGSGSKPSGSRIDNGPGVDNIKRSRLPDYMKAASSEDQARFMSPETESLRAQIGISSALEGGEAGHAVVEVKLDPNLDGKVTLASELSVRLSEMTA
jgi:hypothetical protein